MLKGATDATPSQGRRVDGDGVVCVCAEHGQLLSAGLVRGFPGTGGAEDRRTSGTQRWEELRLQLTCCAPY